MRVARFSTVVAVASLALGGVACTGHTPRATSTTTVTATHTVIATATVTTTQQQRTVVTVAPPTQAPTGVVGDIVTSNGTAFRPPATRVTKAYADEAYYENCHGLADAGYYVDGCTLAQSTAGAAVGLIETAGTSERDLIYTVHGPTATLALSATRTVPKPQSGGYSPDATRVETADVALDNTPKLVFYTPVFSATYVNAYESVDVVEATGRVVIHRDLDGGVATHAFGGGLETWVPDGAQVERDIVQWRSGAWRVTAADVVSKDTVPTNSQL